jgi:hypothetical protein
LLMTSCTPTWYCWVKALMSGNHPVVAANHTVILNWNRETIPLLQQIAICQLERGSSAFQGCAPFKRKRH